MSPDLKQVIQAFRARIERSPTLRDILITPEYVTGIASDETEFNSVQTLTDEPIHIVHVSSILDGSIAVIPNLRWLIPMAINDAKELDSCELFQLVEVSHRG